MHCASLSLSPQPTTLSSIVLFPDFYEGGSKIRQLKMRMGEKKTELFAESVERDIDDNSDLRCRVNCTQLTLKYAVSRNMQYHSFSFVKDICRVIEKEVLLSWKKNIRRKSCSSVKRSLSSSTVRVTFRTSEKSK